MFSIPSSHNKYTALGWHYCHIFFLPSNSNLSVLVLWIAFSKFLGILYLFGLRQSTELQGAFLFGAIGFWWRPLVYCKTPRWRCPERKVRLAIWFWQKRLLKSSKLKLKYPNLFRVGKESGGRVRWFIGLGATNSAPNWWQMETLGGGQQCSIIQGDTLWVRR